MDNFLGQISLFAFNYAPKGWAQCNGQLLPIAQNQALFAILGTTYGGDGRTTFQLPDLRGRRAINWGQGPGLSNYVLGQIGGQETVTLNTTQMPMHMHFAFGTAAAGNQDSPQNNTWAKDNNGTMNNYAPFNGANVALMSNNALGTAGGNQPHENRPPYLAANYCIALTGIFPSRP
jgi:microcystin-dependent protein